MLNRKHNEIVVFRANGDFEQYKIPTWLNLESDLVHKPRFLQDGYFVKTGRNDLWNFYYKGRYYIYPESKIHKYDTIAQDFITRIFAGYGCGNINYTYKTDC